MNKRQKKKTEKEHEVPIEEATEEQQFESEEKVDEVNPEKEKVSEEPTSTEEPEGAEGGMVPKDQYIRLLAEFTNYKKRTAQEKDQLLNLARSTVISKLLPVVDDFNRLMDHMDTDNKDVIIDGIEGIFRKMMTTFQSEGLKKIESLNAIFDPNIHDAMMTQPTDDPEKDDTVVMVYEDGYMLNDKLLRAAKVIVAQCEGMEEEQGEKE